MQTYSRKIDATANAKRIFDFNGWPPKSQICGVGLDAMQQFALPSFMAQEACFRLDVRQRTGTVTYDSSVTLEVTMNYDVNIFFAKELMNYQLI